MAAFTGNSSFGMYPNGQAQRKSDYGFTGYNYTTADALSGEGCFAMDGNVRGSGLQSNIFVPVDTSKYYIHSVAVKTYQRSYNNRLGSGHLGFACYDENKTFIDLRNCGGLGNTYLTRPANPGDSIIYVQSNSGWYTGADVTNNRAYFRWVLFYPPSHPKYSTPHEYTRINPVSYYRLEQTAQGDWAMYLSSYRGSATNRQDPTTLPNIGYSLPVGTPISRGAAGGSYNYCHGAPTYPETWTTYTTSPFTGENRNSSLPFRFGTKYIKFLNLRNYNYRSESGGDSAKYYVDNIFVYQAKPPTPVEKAKGHKFKPKFTLSSLRQKIGLFRRIKIKRRF